MTALEEIEGKIVAGVHDLIADAIRHQPAIEDTIGDVLREAGVPEPAITLAAGLVTFLRDHFAADSAAMPPQAPDPAPEPATGPPPEPAP